MSRLVSKVLISEEATPGKPLNNETRRREARY
jgi:hypothetical protein